MAGDRGNHTYHVSDERLRDEELAACLRLAQPVQGTATDNARKQNPPA